MFVPTVFYPYLLRKARADDIRPYNLPPETYFVPPSENRVKASQRVSEFTSEA